MVESGFLYGSERYKMKTVVVETDAIKRFLYILKTEGVRNEVIKQWMSIGADIIEDKNLKLLTWQDQAQRIPASWQSNVIL